MQGCCLGTQGCGLGRTECTGLHNRVAGWLQGGEAPEGRLLVHDEQEHGHDEVHRLTVTHLGVVGRVCTRGATRLDEAAASRRAGWAGRGGAGTRRTCREHVAQ